jgi:hypothetical protein
MAEECVSVDGKSSFLEGPSLVFEVKGPDLNTRIGEHPQLLLRFRNY